MEFNMIDADIAFFIKSEEENYNTQIEQTKKWVQKFEQDLEDMKSRVIQKSEEVKQEEATYKEKIEKTKLIESKT